MSLSVILYIILVLIGIFVMAYRNKRNDSVYKYLSKEGKLLYDRLAPYSYKVIREKVKSMNQDYSIKEYIKQIIMFAGFAGVITYLYFYNIVWSVVYAAVAVSVIPYLTYLRYKRIYSEFIFEQIQVYTTNVIMEYQTTKSFVKALEGVANSGVLEDPVLTDVKIMLDLAYQKGQIDDSIAFMNEKYPFHIVKNMHQLFLQVTKEGARDISGSLDNMSLDIDTLVEGVYRDRLDRQQFHKQFLMYGVMLFFLIAVIQLLLGNDQYLEMIELWYIKLVLHFVLLFNSFFLLNGEKYYNENVGGE